MHVNFRKPVKAPVPKKSHIFGRRGGGLSNIRRMPPDRNTRSCAVLKTRRQLRDTKRACRYINTDYNGS